MIDFSHSELTDRKCQAKPPRLPLLFRIILASNNFPCSVPECLKCFFCKRVFFADEVDYRAWCNPWQANHRAICSLCALRPISTISSYPVQCCCKNSHLPWKQTILSTKHPFSLLHSILPWRCCWCSTDCQSSLFMARTSQPFIPPNSQSLATYWVLSALFPFGACTRCFHSLFPSILSLVNSV